MMSLGMRTTLTLDDDVAEKLKQLAEKRKLPFRRVLNDLLRRALAGQTSRPKAAPFEIQTFCSPLRPGIDPLKLNQLLDDLDVEDARSKLGA
jgi:hypothetical protein